MATVSPPINSLKPVSAAPQPPGLPLLGQSLNMLTDPVRYLTDQYQQYGSVFRVKLGATHYVILAGTEANHLLAREDGQSFTSDMVFEEFGRVTGTDIFIVAIDGPDHKHMRRLMRAGYSRSTIVPHLPAVVSLAQEHVGDWQNQPAVPLLYSMRRLVADQMGIIATNRRPGEYFDDLLYFVNTMLLTTVSKSQPAWLRQLPRFRRVEKRLYQLSDEVVLWHRQNPPDATGRPRDIIDDILASTRPDGQPFTPENLRDITIGPYFAGMDTLASTLGFFLYALLTHPDILKAAQQEVDALFANGTPTLQDFRKLELLHAAAMETLRRYPVTPFTPRQAVTPFTFDGYQIPAGQAVMFAQTVTHFSPEYYPDPYKFDPTRFMGENKARIGGNVFVPFTVGAHACLGAGLAEVQLLITMATMLHTGDYELANPNERLVLYSQPAINPGNRIKVRVKARRHD
ncbi:MAG: cytochrome P450 [Phototrophicaceae bacterium]|jgi:cytochrome P450